MSDERMFPDPLGDEFTKGADEIQKRYNDFFNNHPLNTDGDKWNIHRHCLFGFTYNSNGIVL